MTQDKKLMQQALEALVYMTKGRRPAREVGAA